jgi:pimeloyl-ACP methyl ester carboxylesterase
LSSNLVLKPESLKIGSKKARIWTCGEGPNVVLVHGGMGDAPQHWDELAKRIGSQYRIIAPALPGYEGSDPLEQPSWNALTDWLRDIFDALSIKQAPLAGNSFGAATSRAFTGRFPDRVSTLVLINGGILPPIPPWLGKLLSSPFFSPIHTLFGAASYSRRGIKTMIATDSILTDDFVNNARLQGKHFSNLVMSISAAGPLQFEPFSVPTTVLWGDHDPAFPVKQANALAKAIPSAIVKLVPGVGHMPQLEAPDTFADMFVEAIAVKNTA